MEIPYKIHFLGQTRPVFELCSSQGPTHFATSKLEVGTKSNPENIYQSFQEKEMEMAMVFHPTMVVNLTEETPYQGGDHRLLIV